MKLSEMPDERKKKSQLIEELVELRQRTAQFEKSAIQCRRAEETLRSLAFVDELTGLYNRRGFLVLGQQQIKIGSRTNRQVILLFADIDGMKKINDSFGHPTGDLALVDIAGILKGTFRGSDIVSRWGGDEFAVVALTNDAGSPDILIKRLKEAIRLHNLKQKRPYKLSLSMGIAECNPEQRRSISELLREADAAMYRAKGEAIPSDV
jgi:diguanylate cyclase (GGDEF)-like protein